MKVEEFASRASSSRGVRRAISSRDRRESAGRHPALAQKSLKLTSTINLQGTGFPAFTAGSNFQVFTV